MTDIQETLSERNLTHGSFIDNSRYSQFFKKIYNEACEERAKRMQPALRLEQREALEMIFHKIARILAGNNNEPDHWKDISGYSMLVFNQLTTGFATAPVTRVPRMIDETQAEQQEKKPIISKHQNIKTDNSKGIL